MTKEKIIGDNSLNKLLSGVMRANNKVMRGFLIDFAKNVSKKARERAKKEVFDDIERSMLNVFRDGQKIIALTNEYYKELKKKHSR